MTRGWPSNAETCTTCNIPRKPVAAEPLTNWYELVTHRCPSCKTVLRLVERRPKAGKAVHLNGNGKAER